VVSRSRIADHDDVRIRRTIECSVRTVLDSAACLDLADAFDLVSIIFDRILDCDDLDVKWC
jgi:hypothetical protein